MSIACPSLVATHYPALCTSVDHYCERTSSALDAEPINALTNAAFLVAAWGAWYLYSTRVSSTSRGLIWTLIATIVVVGLGSFLFHTVGTRWAEWGDVLPIMLFMLLYLWLILTMFFGWPAWLKLIALGAYFAATFYFEASVPGAVSWGGALYLPTILLMSAIGVALQRKGSPAAAGMLIAILVFILSFSARSLDSTVCSFMPLGTHFMWHLLNATLLYILMRIVILYVEADTRGLSRSLSRAGFPGGRFG